MTEFRWMKLYARTDEGMSPNSIVAFGKRPWMSEIINGQVVVTRYEYRLLIDAWLVKMCFQWRSPETSTNNNGSQSKEAPDVQ